MMIIPIEKPSKAARQKALLEVLATGGRYSKLEITQNLLLPIYCQFVTRTFDRDIVDLTGRGYNIVVTEHDNGGATTTRPYLIYHLEVSPPQANDVTVINFEEEKAKAAVTPEIEIEIESTGLYSTAEVASILRVSKRMVGFYIQRHQLEAKKVGEGFVISGQVILDFIKRGKLSRGRPKLQPPSNQDYVTIADSLGKLPDGFGYYVFEAPTGNTEEQTLKAGPFDDTVTAHQAAATLHKQSEYKIVYAVRLCKLLVK